MKDNPTPEQTNALLTQAIGELRGFSKHLAHRGMGITASQLRMVCDKAERLAAIEAKAREWAKCISYSERAGTGENISQVAGIGREILAILEGK